MRIVGGIHKGAQIFAPGNRRTRPTSDRVREAIFNILAHGIERFALKDARVLDLFAGTGALGLEALSRGARFAQFVDDSAEARGIIRRNADVLGEIGRCKIWRRDASQLGQCAPQPPFDLVFIDPPYGKDLAIKALTTLIEGDWLNPGAVIVLEESTRVEVDAPTGLDVLDTRIYGDTQVIILRALDTCRLSSP